MYSFLQEQKNRDEYNIFERRLLQQYLQPLNTKNDIKERST